MASDHIPSKLFIFPLAYGVVYTNVYSRCSNRLEPAMDRKSYWMVGQQSGRPSGVQQPFCQPWENPRWPAGPGGKGLPQPQIVARWDWEDRSLGSYSVSRSDRAGKTKGQELRTTSNIVTWSRTGNYSSNRDVASQLFSATNCAVAGHDIPATPAPAPNTQNTSFLFGFVVLFLRFNNSQSLYSTSLGCPSESSAFLRIPPHFATKWLYDLELQRHVLMSCVCVFTALSVEWGRPFLLYLHCQVLMRTSVSHWIQVG